MRLVAAVVALLAVAVPAGCGGAPPRATVVDVAPPVAAPVSRASDDSPPAEAPRIQAIAGDGSDLAGTLERGLRQPRRIQGVGFHHDVPAEWTDLDPATLGSPLIRSAQRNVEAVDSFMTNVNVASEPFAGDGPAYTDSNLIELRKVSTIRAQRRATAGPRPAGDIEARWQNPGGVPARSAPRRAPRDPTLQRYATNGGEGFVITCSAAETAFERERPLCERILDSFRVE